MWIVLATGAAEPLEHRLLHELVAERDRPGGVVLGEHPGGDGLVDGIDERSMRPTRWPGRAR